VTRESKRGTLYQGPGIEEIIPGNIHAGESMEFFVARYEYETDYIHGNIMLENIYQESLEVFGEIAGDPELSAMHPDQAVFIDTETTGLSGGTGTYAFLVGIGYFEDTRFVVEQFLMRDHAEEADMLSLLRERIGRFRYLVSFNGKSFDLPLLEARFILSRLHPDPLYLPHLDLLHPARRIWKRSLESCKLSNLERELLGLERVDDVPGEMIPGIYFKYLETKDPTRMERVLYHNRLDILSLVTLTSLVHRLITDPASARRKDSLEKYSLGRIHFERGRFDEALACLLSALEECTNSEREWEILKYLSMTYKKMDEAALAVQTWKEMIGIDSHREIYPLIELAKYYEHREQDYETAETYARQALELNQYTSSVDPGEIEHRIDRLQKKVVG
jgi:uncharacterized protein YprB with RNaseH-like and TPR domain